MKESAKEGASSTPEQKAQERESIAERFEVVLETLNSKTDVFDFTSQRDATRAKYRKVLESGRDQVQRIVQIIQSMSAYSRNMVTQYRVPSIVRENGFVANLVKGSLIKLEIISHEIHDIIAEVHAKCEATFGDMDPPETILPDEGEEELIVRDTVKGHQTTETEQEF